jgi:FtsZ-binding cell division protein ZapB/regulator of extracellular matrix RemA (YlzA/DUF370 family)
LVGNTLFSTVSGIRSNTITLPSTTANSWNLGGNTNITSTNNIIGITNANSNPLRFFTNNSEKMTITSNGNVGVGTSTPDNGNPNGWGRILDVNGNDHSKIIATTITARVNNGMYSHSSLGGWNGLNGAWGLNGTTSNHSLAFITNYSPKMVILNTGNVGIGSITPQNKLEITHGSANNSGLRFTNLTNNSSSIVNATNKVLSVNASGDVILVDDKQGITTTTNTLNLSGSTLTSTVNGVVSNSVTLPSATGSFWSLGGNNTNITSTNNIIGITNANTNPLRFFTNNSEKMTITSNGNVGVGTILPADALTVYNNSGFRGLTIDGLSSLQSRLTFANNGTHTSVIYRPANTNNLAIWANSASRDASYINTSSANIGINTTTPNNKLEITHGSANNSGLRFTNLTNSSSSLINSTNKVLSVNATGDVILVDDKQGTGNTTNSCNVSGSIPRLNGPNSYTCSQVFDNGTSVGVGVSSGFTYSSYSGATIGSNVPLSSGNVKLEVNGVLRSTMSIVTSDGKLKTDVKDLNEALSIVKSLKGKTYNWSSEFQKKTGVDNGRHIGFIAQEIREVLPELVIEDENKQLGVNYTELIPVLVEAIKEQQNQIDALKSGNKISSEITSSNIDVDAMNKEMNQLKSENQMFKEKFELLEKSISLLCESGCAGLEKAKQNVEDVDALYQSIPNPTDNEALINFYLSKKYNNVSIQINSLEGKSMETIMLDGAQGKGSVKIQLGHYAAQTYFYSLIVDNKVVDTKKLTVIR